MNQPLEPVTPVTTEEVRRSRVTAIAVASAILVALLALAYYVYVVRQPASQPEATPTLTPVAQTETPTETPTALASPSPSPTPSPTSTPSPSPSPEVELVPSVKAFVANFYAAYEAEDRVRLEATFAPDADPNIQDLRKALFFGPDGPTLFIASNLLEKPTSYTVTAAAQSGTGWVVTVSEKRVGGDGGTVTRTNLMTLIPSDQNSGGWLITTYTHAGATGKYNGFTTQ